MNRIFIALTLLFIPLLHIAGCTGEKMQQQKPNYTTIEDIPETIWDSLAKKRVYFGHQSVGFDILEGIKDVMNEDHQIKLNLQEINDAALLNSPVFAHAKIGNNGDPKSKCDTFSSSLHNGLGDKIDIALMKFCYIDVTEQTDIASVFELYRTMISQLKHSYPRIVYIHTTVPLKTVSTGLKAWIRDLLGKPSCEVADNIKRNQINDKIRREYAGKEPLFDLAMIESTNPDAKLFTFRHDENNYYALASEYTYDGGHLNEKGRVIAAKILLVLLANLSN